MVRIGGACELETQKSENPYANNMHRFYELRAQPGTYEFTSDCLPGFTLRSRNPEAMGRHMREKIKLLPFCSIPTQELEAEFTAYVEPGNERYRFTREKAVMDFLTGYSAARELSRQLMLRPQH